MPTLTTTTCNNNNNDNGDKDDYYYDNNTSNQYSHSSLFKIRTITCFVQLEYDDFSLVQVGQEAGTNSKVGDGKEDKDEEEEVSDTNNTSTSNNNSNSNRLEDKICQVVTFLNHMKDQLIRNGYIVQTIRIATNPFGEWLLLLDNNDTESLLLKNHSNEDADTTATTASTITNTTTTTTTATTTTTTTQVTQIHQRLQQLHTILAKYDITFCSLGPATTSQQVQSYILPILQSSNIFSTSALLQQNDVTMANSCATTIQQIAYQTENGEGNFRFCVAASTVDYIPFFPIATAPSILQRSSTTTTNTNTYQFSIGLENGILINELLRQCSTIQNIPTTFAQGMDQALIPVQQICQHVTQEYNKLVSNACTKKNEPGVIFEFAGIDTSCNPSLEKNGSIASAMECIEQVQYFGGPGTLAVASIMTKTIQSLPNIQHCGYSGIMLPVCEDFRLAQMTQPSNDNDRISINYKNHNNNENENDQQTIKTRNQYHHQLRISDLLSISQVCGVGIDTVPIPGDCSITELTSILLDVAGLAYRWNKPLSCRVFPVPNKTVGDTTNFQSPYLINAYILPLSS